MTEIEKIETFWTWFQQNNSKYLFLGDVLEEEKEILMNDFLTQLHKYCDGLYFVMGGHPEDDYVELIITAEGNKEYFDKVELLVDAAPKLKDWIFIKFKQPHGPGFTTTYGRIKFDPEKIIFIPLENQNNPDLIGINICYSELNEENRITYINATYQVLDALLGEKAVTCDIDFLDITKTPAEIAKLDFMHLSSLGDYIKERKKR